MTSRDRILAELRKHAARAHELTGWSLDVKPTSLGPGLPWDYIGRAKELIRTARTVLDMGTGGGEAFSEICARYTGYAVATEPWDVNAPVAAKRLSAQGIPVVRASSLQLPFRDEQFDLVLNRHEELDPTDTTRVVAAGGRVLTQQVHPDDWKELRDFFPRKTDFGPHFDLYRAGFERAGLRIVQALVYERPVAYRLGDLVYMLVAAPWTIPDFDLDRDLDALLAVERALSRPEGIVLTEKRYLIEAEKPVE